MANVEKLLGQLLAGGIGQSRSHKRSRGSVIPGVGKAQLGMGVIGLAIAAWEHFKSQPATAQGGTVAAQPPPPPPPRPQAPPPQTPAPSSLPPPTAAAAGIAADSRSADAGHLIRSMIAAAHADGIIDAEERSAILERAMDAGLDPPTQQFLMGELRAPATLEQVVAATRPELRLETYAAALLAVSVDTDAEQQYLDRLAAALGLTSEDRERINQQLQLG